jgi:hypothetical protein
MKPMTSGRTEVSEDGVLGVVWTIWLTPIAARDRQAGTVHC